MSEEESQPSTVQLGVFSVEYLGLRRGLRALRILAGRHELHVFATLNGIAAKVSAEMDGRALVRRKKRRPYRVWSNDRRVRMWIISAASDTYRDGRPRFTAKQIARNLRLNSGTGANVSETVVHRLLWKLCPQLAERRGNYFRAKLADPAVKKRVRSLKDAERRAAVKAARVDALKKAGLL